MREFKWYTGKKKKVAMKKYRNKKCIKYKK